jgi:hypothetical protein
MTNLTLISPLQSLYKLGYSMMHCTNLQYHCLCKTIPGILQISRCGTPILQQVLSPCTNWSHNIPWPPVSMKKNNTYLGDNMNFSSRDFYQSPYSQLAVYQPIYLKKNCVNLFTWTLTMLRSLFMVALTASTASTAYGSTRRVPSFLYLPLRTL